MSGAEVLAAVGLASNILQFIEFTSHLCIRIKEYSSTTSGLPKDLASKAIQLAELLGLLQEISKQSDKHFSVNGTLAQCASQAQELADLLETLQGRLGASRWGNAKVAFKSLKRAEQIEKLQTALDHLISLLTLHLQVQTKRTSDQTGTDVSNILNAQQTQLDLLFHLKGSRDSETADDKVGNVQYKPLWMVPLSRNSNFVGREDVLEQVRESLSKRDGIMPVAVLHGLGGVGKTQVALEYISRIREQMPSVFWIHASEPSRFVDSYKRIASEFQIPGREDSNADVLQLVRHWLETSYQLDWVMVVDNVDDYAILFEHADNMTTHKALIEYIPQSDKGSIIYTTRSRTVGIDLAVGKEPISVLPPNTEDCLKMLGDKLTRNSTEEDQVKLLKELAFLPLAISQAAAFMNKRRKQIADYIIMLQDEQIKSRVLDHRALYHGREDRLSESVLSTWWITFQHIRKTNPRAAQLLMLMSLLDPSEVPLAILQDPAEDTFDFEEAVEMLDSFSLIYLYPYSEVCEQTTFDTLKQELPDIKRLHPNFCDMHGLVQTSTREWLARPENEQLSIATQALELFSHIFPSGWYETWPVCRLLYPHADALLEYTVDDLAILDGTDDKTYCEILYLQSLLLHNFSTYLRKQGYLKLSEKRATLALDLRRRIYPEISQAVLESMESVALIISQSGREEEACLLQRQVLEGWEKLYGPDDRHTLEGLNQLGSTLQSMGAFPEAETLHRRELVGTKELLNKDPGNPDLAEDVIIALNNVSRVLRNQGEYAEAERLLQEAIRLSKETHRSLHEDWLIMESIAILKGQLGRFDEAEALFDQVLAGRIEAFGETHPSTLITRAQYTQFLQQSGRYEQVEGKLELLIEDEISFHGPGAHTVWKSIHNLGMTLIRQKKFEKAESTFRWLLRLQNEATQPWEQQRAALKGVGNEPHISSSRDLIGYCLKAQGKQAEAQAYEEPLSPISDDGTEEAKRLHLDSCDLFDEGLFSEAETKAKEELEIRARDADFEERDGTHECRLLIARAMHEQKEYTEAHALAREVLASRKRMLGWRHPETRATLQFLAASLRDSGAIEDAEASYRLLLLWIENTYGQRADVTYEARWGLANVLSIQRKDSEAEELYRMNLEMQLDNTIDADPRDTAQAYHNLGCVLWNRMKLDEAEACFRSAYPRRVDCFGRSDPLAIKTLFCLAEVIVEQNGLDDAASWYLLLGETLELPESDDDEDKDEEEEEEEEKKKKGEGKEEEDLDQS